MPQQYYCLEFKGEEDSYATIAYNDLPDNMQSIQLGEKRWMVWPEDLLLYKARCVFIGSGAKSRTLEADLADKAQYVSDLNLPSFPEPPKPEKADSDVEIVQTPSKPNERSKTSKTAKRTSIDRAGKESDEDTSRSTRTRNTAKRLSVEKARNSARKKSQMEDDEESDSENKRRRTQTKRRRSTVAKTKVDDEDEEELEEPVACSSKSRKRPIQNEVSVEEWWKRKNAPQPKKTKKDVKSPSEKTPSKESFVVDKVVDPPSVVQSQKDPAMNLLEFLLKSVKTDPERRETPPEEAVMSEDIPIEEIQARGEKETPSAKAAVLENTPMEPPVEPPAQEVRETIVEVPEEAPPKEPLKNFFRKSAAAEKVVKTLSEALEANALVEVPVEKAQALPDSPTAIALLQYQRDLEAEREAWLRVNEKTARRKEAEDEERAAIQELEACKRRIEESKLAIAELKKIRELEFTEERDEAMDVAEVGEAVPPENEKQNKTEETKGMTEGAEEKSQADMRESPTGSTLEKPTEESMEETRETAKGQSDDKKEPSSPEDLSEDGTKDQSKNGTDETPDVIMEKQKKADDSSVTIEQPKEKESEVVTIDESAAEVVELVDDIEQDKSEDKNNEDDEPIVLDDNDDEGDSDVEILDDDAEAIEKTAEGEAQNGDEKEKEAESTETQKKLVEENLLETIYKAAAEESSGDEKEQKDEATKTPGVSESKEIADDAVEKNEDSTGDANKENESPEEAVQKLLKEVMGDPSKVAAVGEKVVEETKAENEKEEQKEVEEMDQMENEGNEKENENMQESSSTDAKVQSIVVPIIQEKEVDAKVLLERGRLSGLFGSKQ